MGEEVDILTPPMFEPSGVVKTRREALAAGDWIQTANFWIVSRKPEPAIVYQQRGFDRSWGAGLLDVSPVGT